MQFGLYLFGLNLNFLVSEMNEKNGRQKFLEFLLDNGYAEIKNHEFIITDKGMKYWDNEIKKYRKKHKSDKK